MYLGVLAAEAAAAWVAAAGLLTRRRWGAVAFVVWWVIVCSRLLVSLEGYAGGGWRVAFFGTSTHAYDGAIRFFLGNYVAFLTLRGLVGLAPLLVALLVGGVLLARRQVMAAPGAPSPHAGGLGRQEWVGASILCIAAVTAVARLESVAVTATALLVVVLAVPVFSVMRAAAVEVARCREFGWIALTLLPAWLFAGAVLLPPPLLGANVAWYLILGGSAAAYVSAIGRCASAWKTADRGRAAACAGSSVVALIVLAGSGLLGRYWWFAL